MVSKHRRSALFRAVLVGVVAGATGLFGERSGAAASAPAVSAQAARGAADLPSAKKYYKDGQVKFHAGDFAGALADFQSANEIKVTPQAQRYIGRCFDALGQYPAAIEWYEKFLAHVPAKMKLQGDRTRARIAEIRAGGAAPGAIPSEGSGGRLASTLGRAGSPSAVSIVDIDAVDTAGSNIQTVPPVVLVSPAPAAPADTSAGAGPSSESPTRSNPADVSNPSGGTEVAGVDILRTPETPPRAPAHRSMLPAFITAGAAVLAAGVGTTFGIMALDDKARFDAHDTPQNASTRNEHALLSDIAFGSAFAFGATSLVLFVMTAGDPSREPDRVLGTGRKKIEGDAAPRSAAITPAPFIGPHAGGAGVLVRF